MDVEQRARAFIASRTSNPEFRQDVLDGDYDDTDWFGHVAAALTPPEGFVLVPVEPTEEMLAATDYDYRARGIWTLMVAARPEVEG